MKDFIWQRHVANALCFIAFAFYILFMTMGTNCEVFVLIAMPSMILGAIFLVISEIKEAKHKPFTPFKTILPTIGGLFLLSVYALKYTDSSLIGVVIWGLYFLAFIISNVQVIMAEKKKKEVRE